VEGSQNYLMGNCEHYFQRACWSEKMAEDGDGKHECQGQLYDWVPPVGPNQIKAMKYYHG